MINPKCLCRKHLMGEHVECHMIAGTINKQKSINGFIKNNLIEPESIKKRHDILAEEMIKRNYNHKSSLIQPNIEYLSNFSKKYKINVESAKKDLYKRCEECKKRFLKFSNKKRKLVFK